MFYTLKGLHGLTRIDVIHVGDMVLEPYRMSYAPKCAVDQVWFHMLVLAKETV